MKLSVLATVAVLNLLDFVC